MSEGTRGEATAEETHEDGVRADGTPRLGAGPADPASAIGTRSFEQFFELCRDMLCFAGTDGYFKRVNPAFVEALGYAEEELLSRPFLEFVHPEDRGRTIAELGSLGDGKETQDFENRYRTKSGDYRWIEWSAKPTAGGEIYAIARDVTETRRALDALRDRERRFREIAEHIDGVFYVYDARGRELEYVSPAFDRILGRPRALLYGDPSIWSQAIASKDRDRVRQAWKRCDADDGFDEEYAIQRPDGAVRHVWDRAAVIRSEGGKAVRIVGIADDVSRRRAAEDKARAREAELAHMSRLSNLGEMASGIAHELNQPLSAIATHAETCRLGLSRGSLECALKDLESIAVQAERAGQILRRLRRMVRKQEPTATLVDVRELVGDAVRLVGHELDERRVELTVETEPDLFVQGDPVQLQQVLINLLQNALHAVEDARERRVHLRSRAEAGSVVLAVADTGPGIAQPDRARVFEPFFTTKHNGLGIGLSLSRSIAESHGGRLRARPADGGALFECVLPIAER